MPYSPTSNCIPSVVAELACEYPNVNLQDIVMEEVIHTVQLGRVELGITFESETADGLNFQTLFNDRFIALLPPKNVLTPAKTVSFVTC